MKKRIAALAFAAAAALVLSGCSAAQPEGDKTITFMGWGSPEEISTFKTMISQYEEKYPDVTVDYITVADSDFATKLQTMIASKTTPDVFYLQPDKLTQYVDAGLLADLSSYVDDNQEFQVDNVWSKALDMYRYDGTVRGTGAIYGLPKDIGPFALAYNKDLFDAAGITAPTDDAPWTWDEYEAAAAKLTTGSGNDTVYGSTPFSLESAVWSNGGDWLNADRTKVTVDDPKFVEALQWVADLNLVDHVVPSAEEQSALPDYQRFVDGKVAMMGIGPWNQGGLWNDAKFNWDIMPWPVSPATGTEAIWLGSIGFGVSSTSKDQTDAANLAAFMAFNQDAQRTNIEKGQAIPNLIDLTKSEYLTSDKAPANKQEFIRIIEDYGRIATQTQTYNTDWFNLFNSNLSSVWKGEKTAAEYTASVKDEMQQLLDEGIAEHNK